MKINLTTIYVDDQVKALAFYTDVVGFTKKNDFTNGPYRWLTVASPEDPDGTELQLAANDSPHGSAYQHALRAQNQPAAMFATSDIDADYERMNDRANFTMPPFDAPWSRVATFDDTCGNLVQLVQLKAWQ